MQSRPEKNSRTFLLFQEHKTAKNSMLGNCSTVITLNILWYTDLSFIFQGNNFSLICTISYLWLLCITVQPSDIIQMSHKQSCNICFVVWPTLNFGVHGIALSSVFSNRVINKWNQQAQRVVDASSINAFKGCLDKIRKTRMGFIVD